MPKQLFTSTFSYEGKRYYVRSTKSQKDADQKAAIRRKELEDNTVVVSPSTTVSQYAELWLATYKEPAVSRPVYAAYKATVNNVIVPGIGRLKLSDVRPINLQRIINDQVGMSRNYYIKLRYTIQQLFNQARRDKLIRDNPSEMLSLPASKDGTNRSITTEERKAVLKVAETHRFGLFIQVMLWCGARPQEVAALRCEDVNEIGKTLHIMRALNADGVIGDTKSPAGVRAVPVPPPLWERVQPLLHLGGYLIKPPRGGHYTKSSIKCAWKGFRREVDIALGAKVEDGAIVDSVIADDLTLYCLRHTYCTDLQAAGIPINVARDLMGHSKIDLTARIYTHMRCDVLEDTAAKIAAYYGATVGATSDGQNEPKLTIAGASIGITDAKQKAANNL